MLCALCIALSAAVQLVFSGFGADGAVYFSVFICAVCCPVKYGVFCSVLCPMISMMAAGSPAAVLVPAGIAKCLVFLLISRFLLERVRTGKPLTDLYICLIPSVCVGQIVGALISSAIFCRDSRAAILFVFENLLAAIPEMFFLLAAAPGTVLLLKSLGIVEEKPLTDRKNEDSV